MGTRTSMTSLEDAVLGREPVEMRRNYVTRPENEYTYDPKTNKTSVDFGASGDVINIEGEQSSVDEYMPPNFRSPANPQYPIPDTMDDGVRSITGEVTPEQQSANALSEIAKQQKEAKRNQAVLAGAKFFMDMQNAQSAYAAHSAATQMNIMNSKMQARDALARGRQRALEERQRGEAVGNEALLALAAQGQDVSGANAQSVESSYEAIGAYNALMEETNSIREALGFELEEVALDYELEQRRIERDTTIISSALNFAASSYNAGII